MQENRHNPKSTDLRLRMKSLVITFFFVLSPMFLPSWGSDLDKGLTAYSEGDYAAALDHWGSLAEEGNAVAQFNLGVMYSNGRGVSQDDTSAVRWYRLAAEQVHADAQYNLGLMYSNGRGILEDDTAAVRWYRLAAEQGKADAQNNLGFMYETGEGVIQDSVYAYMWFSIAASSGLKEASGNRDTVAKRMNSNQIEKAQRLARECVRKKYKGC